MSNDKLISRKPLFTLSCKRYYFAPTLLPTVITLLFLPILIALGCWQWNRALQKEQWYAQYQSRSKVAPLNLNQVTQLTTLQNFQPVIMQGHFDNAHQFLLDNKIQRGQVGYHVLAPFILTETKQVILINRGWIPQGKSRDQLPFLKPIAGKLTLTGTINYFPKKTFKLNEKFDDSNHWPRRIQQIETASLQSATGYAFPSFVVLLSPAPPYGYVRNWAPAPNTAAKNYGYAFQWFALTLTLMIIFIGVNTRKK